MVVVKEVGLVAAVFGVAGSTSTAVKMRDDIVEGGRSCGGGARDRRVHFYGTEGKGGGSRSGDDNKGSEEGSVMATPNRRPIPPPPLHFHFFSLKNILTGGSLSLAPTKLGFRSRLADG